ncbi:hypothetical protein ACEWY4_009757 [Coilia grayii]|uniref:Bcr-Abl oncoprotein oligomerisation domain-containing protein n=1 Tax=Coilia grayii TaxID=363190 RepID=A0ABD1K7D6_9TELE
MWEQGEFEKHWKKEFPDGEVPRMNLKSVEDIEIELDKCKSNLRKLQQALEEEKFKVIFLQTTLNRSKKSSDKERWDRIEVKLVGDTTTSDSDKKQQKQDQGVEVKDRERPVQPVKDPMVNKRGEDPARNSSFARDTPAKPGKPIPPPRKNLSAKKAFVPAPSSHQVVDGSCFSRTEEHPGGNSDHEYEEVGLNHNFVSKNLVNPNPRDSLRLNPHRDSHRDVLRPFRLSRELDSSDDGRLSPLGIQVAGGSGRSTPDRRSDGYQSSDSGKCHL